MDREEGIESVPEPYQPGVYFPALKKFTRAIECTLRQRHQRSVLRALLDVLAAILWGAFLFLVLGLLVYSFFSLREFLCTSPFFSVSKIHLSGDPLFTLADFTRYTGFQPGQNLFSLDLEPVRRRILKHPRVHTGTVALTGWGELSIVITARKPFCLLLQNGHFHELDRSGVVLGEANEVANSRLPILNAAALGDLKPGERIERPEILKNLPFLDGLPESIQHRISDFNIDRHGRFFFYTIDGIRVFPPDRATFLRRYPQLKELLSHLKLRNLSVKYIDMRFGDDFVLRDAQPI